MTTFWILAAGLMFLVVALLAVPLLRGGRRSGEITADQRAQDIAIARERLEELRRAHQAGELSDEAYEDARAEIEVELLEDTEGGAVRPYTSSGRWLLPVLVLGLPALAVGLYLKLGTPSAIVGQAPTPAAAPRGAHDLESLVAKLAERMRRQPDDPRGWLLLGRSYMTLGRYPEAVQAFRKLRALVGDRPGVLVPLADALAMTRGGRLDGEPFTLLQKAYAQAPNDPTALWLLGMAWMQRGDATRALEFWYRLRPKLAGDPRDAAELGQLIARAEARLKAEGKPLPKVPEAALAASEKGTPSGESKDKGASGGAVRVHVELDPALADAVSPGDTLFVYAKAWQGPPMPLAVYRGKASSLPLEVTLDDSMAMMPAMRISRFDALRIEARISHSGNAIAQPGDLIASAGPVKPGSRVRLRIDHRKE